MLNVFLFSQPQKRIMLNMLLYQMSDFNLNVTIWPLSFRTQLVYKQGISHIGQSDGFSIRDKDWRILPKINTSAKKVGRKDISLQVYTEIFDLKGSVYRQCVLAHPATWESENLRTFRKNEDLRNAPHFYWSFILHKHTKL